MRLAALLLLSASFAFAAPPSKPEASKKPEPAKVAPKPEAKPTKPEPAKQTAPGGAFVGNKDSKVFHKADCGTAAKMKAGNKTPLASKAEAEKQGFKACKVCLN